MSFGLSADAKLNILEWKNGCILNIFSCAYDADKSLRTPPLGWRPWDYWIWDFQSDHYTVGEAKKGHSKKVLDPVHVLNMGTTYLDSGVNRKQKGRIEGEALS